MQKALYTLTIIDNHKTHPIKSKIHFDNKSAYWDAHCFAKNRGWSTDYDAEHPGYKIYQSGVEAINNADSIHR